MNKLKRILWLFLGRDKWAEEVHDNKNKVAVESIKTERKLRQFNSLLFNDQDTARLIGRAMGAVK